MPARWYGTRAADASDRKNMAAVLTPAAAVDRSSRCEAIMTPTLPMQPCRRRARTPRSRADPGFPVQIALVRRRLTRGPFPPDRPAQRSRAAPGDDLRAVVARPPGR